VIKISQQMEPYISIVGVDGSLGFLTPDKKWSDKNGKEFDLESP